MKEWLTRTFVSCSVAHAQKSNKQLSDRINRNQKLVNFVCAETIVDMCMDKTLKMALFCSHSFYGWNENRDGLSRIEIAMFSSLSSVERFVSQNEHKDRRKILKTKHEKEIKKKQTKLRRKDSDG